MGQQKPDSIPGLHALFPFQVTLVILPCPPSHTGLPSSFTMPSVALFAHAVPYSEKAIPPDVCHADLSFKVVKSTDSGVDPGAIV